MAQQLTARRNHPDPPTIEARATEVTVDEHQHARKPGRKTSWTFFWVLFGALASGAFILLMLTTFFGAYYFAPALIPPYTMPTITRVWPIAMGLYVFSQIIPMFVRYQTKGWDVPLDFGTSVLALLATFGVAVLWWDGTLHLDGDGKWMLLLAALANLTDMALLLLGYKLTAAARDEV